MTSDPELLPPSVTAGDLWNSTPDAVIIVDNKGKIIAANERVYELFELEPDSLLGCPVEDLVPAESRQRHRVHRKSYEKSPNSRPMGSGERLVGLSGTGRVFPIHVSLAPISDTEFTVAAIRDMSDWLGAERELEEARYRMNQAEDHERIARELHDTVIQELFAIGLGLQSFQPLNEDLNSTRLTEIIQHLDDTTQTIRSVIYDLSSPVHSEEGLRSRTITLIDLLSRTLGIKPRCHFVGPLDTAVADDLVEESLAVIREAITNVARHAEASEVSLSIKVDQELTIEVVDNGRGLPKKSTRQSGLVNLADRAANRNGTFTAVSAPSGGTVVTWVVPLLIVD